MRYSILVRSLTQRRREAESAEKEDFYNFLPISQSPSLPIAKARNLSNRLLGKISALSASLHLCVKLPYYNKMPQGFGYAVFVIGKRHIVGGGQHLRSGVRHCHADAGHTHH